MCIAAGSVDAGELAQLALERHEVGDHLDGLDRRGVGVGPAGELVQVVADAGDLPGALALDLGRRRGPGAGPRHGLPQQVGQRHAHGRRLGPPVGELGRRHAGVHSDGAAVTHRRTARKERGHGPPLDRESRRAAGCRGFEGGAQRPLASPNVRTLGRLAPDIYTSGASCFRAPFPSFVSWSFRTW